jgi:NADH:ubiquinone oxidoreductase subunit F (NADH-binding)
MTAAAEIPVQLAADALPRLFAGAVADRPLTLAEHVDRFGRLPDASGRSRLERLIELLEEAGVTGRGGAGFPTGRKLRAVSSARRRAVVVANAVEGEPVSDKDKALLRHTPHLVLDGISLAASALDAHEAYIALAESAVLEHDAVRRALAERERNGVDSIPIRVARVPDGFVAGEETALVRAVGGGPAKPTFTPPRPFERGVGGAPTLVQNAETLAQLALVARFGSAWFRRHGTDAEPGTALVTVSGAVHRPGVYEAPLGLPLRDLLDWAGGATEPLSALLVGGYFGSWLGAEDALGLRLLDSDLRGAGASLGARAIVAFPRSACGLVETARVVRWLAGESAGQCGPCVFGLEAIADAFERLAAHRPGPADDVAQLERLAGQVSGRGACRHPDGTVRLVASALRAFAGEVEVHHGGRCRGTRRSPLPLGVQS